MRSSGQRIYIKQLDRFMAVWKSMHIWLKGGRRREQYSLITYKLVVVEITSKRHIAYTYGA